MYITQSVGNLMEIKEKNGELLRNIVGNNQNHQNKHNHPNHQIPPNLIEIKENGRECPRATLPKNHQPYEFTGFGAMDVTKPYEFIRFGTMDVTKPYEFIWFGTMDVTKPYEFIGFGAMDVTKPYEFMRLNILLSRLKFDAEV